MDATLAKDRIHICQELTSGIDKTLATLISTVSFGFLEEDDGEKVFTLQEHVVDFLDHSEAQQLCLSVLVQTVLQKLTRIADIIDRTRNFFVHIKTSKSHSIGKVQGHFLRI